MNVFIKKHIHVLFLLQVLNLERNRISILPNSIENLKHLQTLNMKGNDVHVHICMYFLIVDMILGPLILTAYSSSSHC